jgi:hypothetical protein
VGLNVVGFNLKVSGKEQLLFREINWMHNVNVLSKAKRDQVTISEIKTKLVGAGSYLLPRTVRLFLKYNNK